MAGMVRGGENVEALGNAPIRKLFLKLAWPSLIAVTLNALYAIVDRAWIGQGCGQDSIAGLTLTFPIMLAFGAFGVFVGAGHGALLSIKLGEGDRVACEKIVGEMLALKLLFFFILPPLVFVFLDPILKACGGAGVTPGALNEAKRYLGVVLFSHVFSHIAFGLSGSMRSEGAARASMMCMVVGFLTNLILDPVLIFWFDMGIMGAAWATVVAMFLSCVFALHFYISGRSVVRLRLKRIWIYPKYLLRTSAIGFGPFSQQLLGALVNVSVQMALVKWADSPEECTVQVAALGVFQASVVLIMMPTFGILQGVAPIMGYNWGARKYYRVLRTVVLGLILVTGIMVFFNVILAFAPGIVSVIFMRGENEALYAASNRVLIISNCMIWCIGLNIVFTTFFQSIGKPMIAILLSALRQGLCLIPCIWLLPYFIDDHVFAIWLAMPLSDVLTFFATLPSAYTYMKFLKACPQKVNSARCATCVARTVI